MRDVERSSWSDLPEEDIGDRLPKEESTFVDNVRVLGDKCRVLRCSHEFVTSRVSFGTSSQTDSKNETHAERMTKETRNTSRGFAYSEDRDGGTRALRSPPFRIDVNINKQYAPAVVGETECHRTVRSLSDSHPEHPCSLSIFQRHHPNTAGENASLQSC